MSGNRGYGFVIRARIDDDLHRRLQAEAQRQDRTVSNLARMILRQGLEVVETSRAIGSPPTWTDTSLESTRSTQLVR